MTLLKQAMTVLGTVLTIAVLVAVISPKTAHAVAAALVQIVPGTTTHVGQNESQLVSLDCGEVGAFCVAISPDGDFASSAYVVPTGYTLIITDYQFTSSEVFTPGAYGVDEFSTTARPSFILGRGFATVNTFGYYSGSQRFITGIRVGSGETIQDFLVSSSRGLAWMQGYLVPNA